MKSLIKLLVFALISASASSAFALGTFTYAVYSSGGIKYKPSNNVTIKVISAVDAYAAASQHSGGAKQYGTLSSDTVIKSATAVTSGPTDPADKATLGTGTWQ